MGKIALNASICTDDNDSDVPKISQRTISLQGGVVRQSHQIDYEQNSAFPFILSIKKDIFTV